MADDDDSFNSEGTPSEYFFRVSENYRLERERSAALQAGNDELGAEVAQLRAEGEQLRAEVEQLREWQELYRSVELQNARQVRQHNESLRQEIAGLQARFNELQSDNEALDAQNETQREEINALNERSLLSIATLEQQNGTLQTDNHELQSQNERLQQELELAKAAAIEKEQQIAEHLTQLDSKDKSLAVEQEKIESSRQEIQMLNEQNETLQNKIVAQNERSLRNVACHEQQMEELQKHCHQLESRNEGLQQELQSAEQIIASHHAANHSQEQQIAELQTQLKSTIETLATLRDENADLQSRCNGLQSDNESHEVNILSSTKTIQTLQENEHHATVNPRPHPTMSTSRRSSRRTKTSTSMAEVEEPLEDECRVCDKSTPREQANKCTGADCTAIVCNSCLRSLQKPSYNCGKTKCKRGKKKEPATSMEEENSASDANSSSSDDSLSYCSDEASDVVNGPNVVSTSSTPKTQQDERRQTAAMATNSPDCDDSDIPWGERKLPAIKPPTAKQKKTSAADIASSMTSNPVRVSMSPPSLAAHPKRQKQHGDNDLILIQPNPPRSIDAPILGKIHVAFGGRVSPDFGQIQSSRNADDQNFHLMLGSQCLANKFRNHEIYVGAGVDVAYSVSRRDGFHGSEACNRLLAKISRVSKKPGFVATVAMFSDPLRIGLYPSHHHALESAVKSNSQNPSSVLTLFACGKNSLQIAQLQEQRSELISANNALHGSFVNPGTGLPRSEVGEKLHRNVMTKKDVYYDYAEEHGMLHPHVQSAVDRGVGLSLPDSVLEVLEDTWTGILEKVANQSLTIDGARDEWIRVSTMFSLSLANNTIVGYVRPSPPSGSLEARDEQENFSIDDVSVYQSSLILGAFGVEGIFSNPLPPDSNLVIMNDHHRSGHTDTRESFLTSLAYIAHGNIQAIIQSTQNRASRDPTSNSIWLSIMEKTNTEVINALNIGQATSVDTHPTGLQTARVLAERHARRLQENDASLEALKESIDALPVNCLKGPLFDNMPSKEKGQFSNDMGQICSHAIPEHYRFRAS